MVYPKLKLSVRPHVPVLAKFYEQIIDYLLKCHFQISVAPSLSKLCFITRVQFLWFNYFGGIFGIKSKFEHTIIIIYKEALKRKALNQRPWHLWWCDDAKSASATDRSFAWKGAVDNKIWWESVALKTFQFFFVIGTHENCRDSEARTVILWFNCHPVRSSFYSTRLRVKVPAVRSKEKGTEMKQIPWKC
jgi:hypothetical protein